MNKSDILAIVQAHMPSERFPGKLLAPLFGQPVIYWTIQRALKIGCKVCAVIPEAKENDVLAAWVEQWCDVVREGCVSRKVLDCFIRAIDKYKPKAVIRLCGDAPFLDLAATNLLIKQFYECHTYATYSVNGTPAPLLAYGVFPEIVQADALVALATSCKKMGFCTETQEHVTPLFYTIPDDTMIFQNVTAGRPFKSTIDTLEDLKRINTWVGPASWRTLILQHDSFRYIGTIVNDGNAGSPKTDYAWMRNPAQSPDVCLRNEGREP